LSSQSYEYSRSYMRYFSQRLSYFKKDTIETLSTEVTSVSDSFSTTCEITVHEWRKFRIDENANVQW